MIGFKSLRYVLNVKINILFKSFFKLLIVSNFLYQPVLAADSPPIWSKVQAKGPTGSAFLKTSSQLKNELAKRQDCINRKAGNTIAGAAIGGILGNKIFGGNTGASIGAAAGGAIGASAGPDC